MARGPAPSVPLLASIIAALTAITAPSIAQQPPQLIQIVYSAPLECPDAKVLESEVRKRSRRPWLSAGRVSPRTFRVTITSRYRGRLVAEDPSGSTRSDEVSGMECADVVSALAIQMSLSIDGGSPRSMASLEPLLQPLPVLEESRWTFQPALLQIEDRPPPWRLSMGANVSALGSLSSNIVPSVSIYIDLSRIDEGLEAPTIRLSLLRAIDDFSINSEIIAMEWVAGRLEGCPLRSRVGPFTLSPCLAIDTGKFEWKTELVSAARLWIAVDLIGRFQLTLFERLILEAQVGVVLPIIRDEFGLGEGRLSGKSVHRVPVISGMVGGGTGIRFP